MSKIDYKKELLALEWSGATIDQNTSLRPACPKCGGVKPGDPGFIPEAQGHRKGCVFLRMADCKDTPEHQYEKRLNRLLCIVKTTMSITDEQLEAFLSGRRCRAIEAFLLGFEGKE